MLERIKNFWGKLAVVIIVMIFILFEIRLTIIVPEVVIEILFALFNFYLLLVLMKSVKKYVRLKWLRKSSFQRQ